MELITDAMIEAIEIKSLADLKKEFDLKIPFASLSEEINKRLRKLQPKVKAAGFRPGKVPLSIVQNEHGEQIFFEVAGDKINHAVADILEKKKLPIVGAPEVQPEVIKNGQDIECKVSFEVLPEIKLTDLTQLKFEQQQAEIQPRDLDEFLLFLRRKEAKDFIEPADGKGCLLYTSPSPRDLSTSRMPSSA